MENSERLTTTKSERRVRLINELSDGLTSHEIFSDNVKRKKDKESVIQKALFLRLEKGGLLKQILSNYKFIDENKLDDFIKNNFLYECDNHTTVKHWNVFGCKHRPDAVLKFDNFKIAIELKLAKSGSSLRGGIGQAILFSKDSAFTVYLVVDTSEDKKILKSFHKDKEQSIVQDLWNNHNILFKVV
jgi:hypothetical protein